MRDSARYTETALKYLLTLDPASQAVTAEDIKNLCHILRANICYLEDKYAAIQVKSKNGKKAGEFFESQVAGTSGLTQRHLGVWQTTAQIAAAGGFTDRPDRGRGSGRGNIYLRRGSGRRNFDRRGDFGQQQGQAYQPSDDRDEA